MSVTVDSEIKPGDLVRFAPSVINILSAQEREYLKGLDAIGLVIDIIVESYGTSFSEDQTQVIFAEVLWPAGYTSRDFTVHLRRVDESEPRTSKNTLEDLGWHISEETPTPSF